MKPLHKIVVLAMILSLLVMAVTPGLAATDKKGPKPKSFNIAGTITAVDPVALTVTVHVVLANKVAKSWIGLDLVVQTDANTKFWEKSLGKMQARTFADLLVGDNVRVKGKFVPATDLTPETWTATRVVKGVPLPTEP